MLYRETPLGFVAWAGEPLNAVRYPLDIERSWSDAQLKAVGLFRALRPEVPADQIIVAEKVARIAGVVTLVFTLAPKPPQSAEMVRAERNQRLAASDWTQLRDARVDQTLWATYRQALRDLPLQSGFPATVQWPTPPV